MPTKFRKNVWIKRGDFCIVEAIEEGDKVKGEIVRILYKDQIRFIKSEKLWPFKDSKVEAKQPLLKVFLRMVACLQMDNTKHMVEQTMDNILNPLSLVINKVQTDSNNLRMLWTTYLSI